MIIIFLQCIFSILREQLLKSRRESASNFLSDQMKSFGYEDNVIFSSSKVLECKTDDYFGIHPFYIEKGLSSKAFGVSMSVQQHFNVL